jgi:hypothetical protein
MGRARPPARPAAPTPVTAAASPPPPTRDLVQTVARAIKAADRTFFNENYTDQALAVMRALREAGYRVVPSDASQEMLEAGRESLKFGVQRTGDSIGTIYRAMIAAHRDKD